jgi:hypothetical protein
MHLHLHLHAGIIKTLWRQDFVRQENDLRAHTHTHMSIVGSKRRAAAAAPSFLGVLHTLYCFFSFFLDLHSFCTLQEVRFFFFFFSSSMSRGFAIRSSSKCRQKKSLRSLESPHKTMRETQINYRFERAAKFCVLPKTRDGQHFLVFFF